MSVVDYQNKSSAFVLRYLVRACCEMIILLLIMFEPEEHLVGTIQDKRWYFLGHFIFDPIEDVLHAWCRFFFFDHIHHILIHKKLNWYANLTVIFCVNREVFLLMKNSMEWGICNPQSLIHQSHYFL